MFYGVLLWTARTYGMIKYRRRGSKHRGFTNENSTF